MVKPLAAGEWKPFEMKKTIDAIPNSVKIGITIKKVKQIVLCIKEG